jgi:hypothetical protein
VDSLLGSEWADLRELRLDATAARHLVFVALKLRPRRWELVDSERVHDDERRPELESFDRPVALPRPLRLKWLTSSKGCDVRVLAPHQLGPGSHDPVLAMGSTPYRLGSVSDLDRRSRTDFPRSSELDQAKPGRDDTVSPSRSFGCSSHVASLLPQRLAS